MVPPPWDRGRHAAGGGKCRRLVASVLPLPNDRRDTVRHLGAAQVMAQTSYAWSTPWHAATCKTCTVQPGRPRHRALCSPPWRKAAVAGCGARAAAATPLRRHPAVAPPQPPQPLRHAPRTRDGGDVAGGARARAGAGDSHPCRCAAGRPFLVPLTQLRLRLAGLTSLFVPLAPYVPLLVSLSPIPRSLPNAGVIMFCNILLHHSVSPKNHNIFTALFWSIRRTNHDTAKYVKFTFRIQHDPE